MKIGVYNRYWNVLGGGEKYIGSIAQYLKSFGVVDLIAHEPFSIAELDRRLNLDLAGCNSIVLSHSSEDAAEDISSRYDLWINGTFQSSVRSRAKRSMLVVMFPFLGGKALKSLWRIAPRKQPLKVQQAFWRNHGFWNTYDLIVALSSYTQDWINRWWESKSEILHPCADLLTCPQEQEKKDYIISVGRFFEGGHNKKHKVMIEAFKQMYDSGIARSWQYHLCGGTHADPPHREYLRSVVEKAKGYPIHIHPDISRDALIDLYCQSSIFWHAAGFGESDNRWPERFEHFGLTTVEAMSAGCVPVVIDKAGQKEIVAHKQSGYLWETLDQLKQYTAELMTNKSDTKEVASKARQASAAYAFPVFSKRLADLLKQIQ